MFGMMDPDLGLCFWALGFGSAGGWVMVFLLACLFLVPMAMQPKHSTNQHLLMPTYAEASFLSVSFPGTHLLAARRPLLELVGFHKRVTVT